jgi:hypothetical protein
VIWESGPWKAELWRLAARLEKRSMQSRWSQASDARLEQEVFIAAYIVRKLIEANKLSTSIPSITVPVHTYPRKSSQMDHMNWDQLDRHFDLDTRREKQLSVRELCNQFIHSYVFMPVFGRSPARLTALLFASDRDRKKVLYELDFNRFMELLRRIADDNPDNARNIRDPKTWEWIVIQWDSRYEVPPEARLEEVEQAKSEVLDAFPKWNAEDGGAPSPSPAKC